MNYHMVFDVESNGLHGIGFSVGFVVVDDLGAEVDSGYALCCLDLCREFEALDPWVAENVLPAQGEEGYLTPSDIRTWFWDRWLEWKYKGARLYADCPWPVEARFLAACVDDDRAEREWQGPYPLLGVEAYLDMAGLDPTGTFERKGNEIPAHHPLNDARQSARMLVEAKSIIRYKMAGGDFLS
jgi:hypothetical protein